MELRKRIAETLQSARLFQGTSQDAVGAHLNVTAQTIGKLERGESNLTVLQLFQITECLGIDPLEFMQRLRDEQEYPKRNFKDVAHVSEFLEIPPKVRKKMLEVIQALRAELLENELNGVKDA